MDSLKKLSRWQFVGAAGAASMVALAGCGGGREDNGTNESSGLNESGNETNETGSLNETNETNETGNESTYYRSQPIQLLVAGVLTSAVGMSED